MRDEQSPEKGRPKLRIVRAGEVLTKPEEQALVGNSNFKADMDSEFKELKEFAAKKYAFVGAVTFIICPMLSVLGVSALDLWCIGPIAFCLLYATQVYAEKAYSARGWVGVGMQIALALFIVTVFAGIGFGYLGEDLAMKWSLEYFPIGFLIAFACAALVFYRSIPKQIIQRASVSTAIAIVAVLIVLWFPASKTMRGHLEAKRLIMSKTQLSTEKGCNLR